MAENMTYTHHVTLKDGTVHPCCIVYAPLPATVATPLDENEKFVRKNSSLIRELSATTRGKDFCKSVVQFDLYLRIALYHPEPGEKLALIETRLGEYHEVRMKYLKRFSFIERIKRKFA